MVADVVGPAFRFPDGVVAGVAFQGYGDAQNIGYIVPTDVINHFLKDVEQHKKYTGFVSLGVTYQTLENSALREFYGLEGIDATQLPPGISPTGILIVQVDEVRNKQFRDERLQKKQPAADPTDIPEKNNKELYGLNKGDILLGLNKIDVADDGTIHFR